MTTDEKLAALAEAILSLAERAAYTWDYDGEQNVSEGVDLPVAIETKLRAIIDEGGKT